MHLEFEALDYGTAELHIDSVLLADIERENLPVGGFEHGHIFVVDPTGGVWEARPLSWQGAHVANQNPGNIGVMCLGNFEVQSPTRRQVQAMDTLIVALGRKYRIPAREVKTHQELAPTACPGRSLQRYMNATRSSRGAIGSQLS